MGNTRLFINGVEITEPITLDEARERFGKNARITIKNDDDE